jgi:hypothetical protein
MRKEVHFSEDDIKGREVLEPFLESVEGMLKKWLIKEWETKVNMRLPALEGWVIEFPKSLNLLIVVLDCEG